MLFYNDVSHRTNLSNLIRILLPYRVVNTTVYYYNFKRIIYRFDGDILPLTISVCVFVFFRIIDYTHTNNMNEYVFIRTSIRFWTTVIV